LVRRQGWPNIDFSRKPERERNLRRGTTFESSKNYRLALVNEHQGEAVAQPSASDDYLTETDFFALFEQVLQKPLDPEESAIVLQFYFEFSPLKTKRTTALLEQAVNAKGTKLHMRYYLEHIRRSTFQSRR
jgi:DNA-directed RNA polymerase specialized sigma24 family protein